MFRILRGAGSDSALGTTELGTLREKMLNCKYNLQIFKEGLDEFSVVQGSKVRVTV